MSNKFYRVGGSVRDELLNLPCKDIDYAVEAPSYEDMKKAILARGGEIYLETPKYFTIRARVPELSKGADFVLCRKDGEYKDGRHPESVTVGDIYDDLARRDFTVNAIAVDCKSGEIIDPHGGRADLRDNQLNFVGSPTARLAEDKLRAFRAVRFAVTKGLQIGREVDHALSELNVWEFEAISVERVREEMFKAFQYNTEAAMHCFFKLYPTLGEIAIKKGIWLQPTIKAK